jgi:Major Facilitator Superfamily
MTGPEDRQGTEPGAYQVPITGASARPRPSRGREVGAKVGHGLGRGARAAARQTGAAGRATYRLTRRATRAEGAGETGLSRLIEVHGLHNAGDTVVTISLAGTLFFQVPSGEARGQVALFLLMTLLPFAVVAPLIGPFLDRFSHGRRWAIGSTMALRAFLCWALASSIQDASAWQFPAALAILIASKAYNVTRAAATPRLLPDGLTLVKANGRMSLAGTVCATIAAPLAVGAATFGPEWSLRLATLVFAAGTVLAILLPAAVDSTRGEQEVPMSEVAGRGGRWRVPGAVVTALRANAGLRLLSGFLTIFLAFLLRDTPLPGWEDRFTLLLGLVVAVAGLGAAIGTLAGSLMRTAHPLRLVKVVLLVDAVVTVVAAVSFSLLTVLLLSLVVGTTQQLGKLALDATIQQRVPERIRTSVFGRSETLIQVAWVAGGGLGVALPTEPRIGLGVVAAILAANLVVVLRGTRRTSGDGAPVGEPQRAPGAVDRDR